MRKLIWVTFLASMPLLLIAQESRTVFVRRIADGVHQPSEVERYRGTMPVEHRGDLVLVNVKLDFPLYIFGGDVLLRNVSAPSIILSQVSGRLDGVQLGSADISLSLVRCQDLIIVNSRFIGPSRIALQSMPGEAWSFKDTAVRARLAWKPENVWRHGTNLAGQGPNGVDPVFVGNGTNRVTVPTPAWPEPGWFQFSTPLAKDGAVMVHGLPEGMVRWVDENTLEMVGGTFELGRQYRYNSYHPEFLSRNITIEDNSFDGYSLAGINTFFTKDLLVRRNRFNVPLPDDATIIPEESFGTVLRENIRVPRDPRPSPARWDRRTIQFIGTTVNPIVTGNENLTAHAQHRNKPFYGYQGDSPLIWAGGESPWMKDIPSLR